MFNVILGTREFNGHWAVAFRGELDLADAPSAAASAAVAGYGPRVVVDLAGAGVHRLQRPRGAGACLEVCPAKR